MPHREGVITHEVKAAATAASMALPPSVRICCPTLAPASSPITTPTRELSPNCFCAPKHIGKPSAPTTSARPVRSNISRREYCLLIRPVSLACPRPLLQALPGLLFSHLHTNPSSGSMTSPTRRKPHLVKTCVEALFFGRVCARTTR